MRPLPLVTPTMGEARPLAAGPPTATPTRFTIPHPTGCALNHVGLTSVKPPPHQRIEADLHQRQHLNTELVKKPHDLLEYVVVHEVAHLLEASHSERFVTILDRHWPQWRESRAELNALPLGAEAWHK